MRGLPSHEFQAEEQRSNVLRRGSSLLTTFTGLTSAPRPDFFSSSPFTISSRTSQPHPPLSETSTETVLMASSKAGSDFRTRSILSASEDLQPPPPLLRRPSQAFLRHPPPSQVLRKSTGPRRRPRAAEAESSDHSPLLDMESAPPSRPTSSRTRPPTPLSTTTTAISTITTLTSHLRALLLPVFPSPSDRG